MFAAGRMVLLLSLGSHGTMVAVSAQFMMPLGDSDIPMNVPFTFRNKQPLPPAPARALTQHPAGTYIHILKGGFPTCMRISNNTREDFREF